jgi:hypothetical protein
MFGSKKIVKSIVLGALAISSSQGADMEVGMDFEYLPYVPVVVPATPRKPVRQNHHPIVNLGVVRNLMAQFDESEIDVSDAMSE